MLIASRDIFLVNRNDYKSPAETNKTNIGKKSLTKLTKEKIY